MSIPFLFDLTDHRSGGAQNAVRQLAVELGEVVVDLVSSLLEFGPATSDVVGAGLDTVAGSEARRLSSARASASRVRLSLSNFACAIGDLLETDSFVGRQL